MTIADVLTLECSAFPQLKHIQECCLHTGPTTSTADMRNDILVHDLDLLLSFFSVSAKKENLLSLEWDNKLSDLQAMVAA